MSTIRYFGGSREVSGRRGVASEMMRFEIQKKGKLPAGERYKRIMKKQLEEKKQQAMGNAYKKPFKLSGAISDMRKMSARTEQALKELAMKKARKLAKEERRMVIIQPRNFHNGMLNKKGQIYDIAGNIVGQVHRKDGRITNTLGWGVGKYKPKSMQTNVVITEAINKYSPYFINLRKMQMMQQQGITQFGVHGAGGQEDVINVYGRTGPGGSSSHNTTDGDAFASYGAAATGPRQNIGVNAWGAQSDNIWGTFADNAWGTSTDNVWGTNTTDVWGGIGPGNLWGVKGPKMWGTGNGKNWIKGITNFLAGFFGLSTKRNREVLRTLNARTRSSNRSAAGSTRTMSAPTTTRTR